MQISIISFSSRADGNCSHIAKYIKNFYGDTATMYCFSDFSISPCGVCNYECFNRDRSCPASNDMELTILDSICSCDLAYYIIPNYCDNPCANYFIFCERGQYYFSKNPGTMSAYEKAAKKFIVISNTEQELFHKILSNQVEGTPDILFLRAKDF